MSTVRKMKAIRPEDYSDYGKLFLHYQAGRGLAQKTIKVQRNIMNLLLAQVPSDFANESDWKKVITKLLAGKKDAYLNNLMR